MFEEEARFLRMRDPMKPSQVDMINHFFDPFPKGPVAGYYGDLAEGEHGTFHNILNMGSKLILVLR